MRIGCPHTECQYDCGPSADCRVLLVERDEARKVAERYAELYDAIWNSEYSGTREEYDGPAIPWEVEK